LRQDFYFPTDKGMHETTVRQKKIELVIVRWKQCFTKISARLCFTKTKNLECFKTKNLESLSTSLGFPIPLPQAAQFIWQATWQ